MEWQTRYLTEPVHIRLSLGGAEGLRAIGYVALTFFAHHFAEVGRTKGLDSFKAYVQSKTTEELVWWEAEDTSGKGAVSPFRFGHTIEVAVSASARRAYARVSLFSALTFATELGEVDVACDTPGARR